MFIASHSGHLSKVLTFSQCVDDDFISVFIVLFVLATFPRPLVQIPEGRLGVLKFMMLVLLIAVYGPDCLQRDMPLKDHVSLTLYDEVYISAWLTLHNNSLVGLIELESQLGHDQLLV